MGIPRSIPRVPVSTGAAHRSRHRHVHSWADALSRRQFLQSAGVVGGAVAATTALRPTAALAAGSVAPKKIPYGLPGTLFGDPHNRHFYHLLPPFPPGSNGQPGQYTECSTITDFDGVLGAANINGTGSGTPTEANPEGRFDFNVDMRFMTGTYIGVDERRHQGTFGFI